MTDTQKTRAQLIAEIEALRDELTSSRSIASSAELSDAGRYRHILENVRAMMMSTHSERFLPMSATDSRRPSRMSAGAR